MDRRAGVWRHHVRAAVYRITKFMIPLDVTTDAPKWTCRYLITLKIYHERLEISYRRVDRLVSPSWFVADLTVAEMACRRDDRTPRERPMSIKGAYLVTENTKL